MRILFPLAYFVPERVSSSLMDKDLLEAIVDAGYMVDILCPTPTRGVDRETIRQYKHIKDEELYNGKVRIHRFWAPRERGGILARAFRYLWCNLRELMIGRSIKNVDLIFAESTPPTQGILAALLKKRHRCPLLYALHDVFPDSLANAGITKKESVVWKIGRIIEQHTYKAADRIIVVSEDLKKNIVSKGVEHFKIDRVYDWVDTARLRRVRHGDNVLYKKLRINPEKYTVVYAGNFGRAQDIDVIIGAARLLTAESNIQFVLFGSGIEKERISQKTKELGLSNIEVFPLMPAELVAQTYSLGDIALITGKPGFGSCGMPSKTWSIMACEIYIIASFDLDSELARIISKIDAGHCVAPGDAPALAQAILQRYRSVQSCRTIFSRGYVMDHASREVCCRGYLESIEKLINPEHAVCGVQRSAAPPTIHIRVRNGIFQ
jgi:glycosyltransferase involved in cell wall biosynthesis